MEEDWELQQFVSAMPKVELHAHLNGCIREDTLFDLAKERNVSLSSIHFGHHHDTNGSTNHETNGSHQRHKKEEEYSYMYNKKPRSLQDCFEMFAEIPKCVDDENALRRITREALEDFAQHHVVYLELRSTPKRMKGMTKKQYIEAVLDEMKVFEVKEEERFQAEQRVHTSDNNGNNESGKNGASSSSSSSVAKPRIRLPMKCRFIVSIDRSGSVVEAEENVDLAIELFQRPNSMVVGMDIGGNPTKNDFRDFLPSISRARKETGLKITVHCAEVPVGESATEEDPMLQKSFQEVKAIFNFKPDRLGHALLLPPSLRDELMDKWNIPVETCPTSNVMTLELAKHVGGSLIHGLQEHPQLKHWLERKFPISVGTDDPGVFNTNATQELLLLARATAWESPQRELKRIVLDSIDQGFCSDALKISIKDGMESCFSTDGTHL